jgi:hypothetical protein
VVIAYMNPRNLLLVPALVFPIAFALTGCQAPAHTALQELRVDGYTPYPNAPAGGENAYFASGTNKAGVKETVQMLNSASACNQALGTKTLQEYNVRHGAVSHCANDVMLVTNFS